MLLCTAGSLNTHQSLLNWLRKKRPTSSSWKMDETYIKVKSRWCYYYRAINKFGATLDFMLSINRDAAAATRFFKQPFENNGMHVKAVIDNSGAYYAGLMNINTLLFFLVPRASSIYYE
jgi:putative transposase